MHARTSELVALVALGLLVPGAGAASAQDSEVHVDPDSPAGKEYALPLDSARQDASGGSGGTGAAGQSAPLFGAGVSKAAGRGGGEGSDSGGGQGDGSSSADRGGSNSGVSGGGTAQVARAVADEEGGLSPGVITLLIAMGVLFVGILIGLSVRVLRRTNSPA
jgi:hypothetical protein